MIVTQNCLLKLGSTVSDRMSTVGTIGRAGGGLAGTARPRHPALRPSKTFQVLSKYLEIVGLGVLRVPVGSPAFPGLPW